MLFTNPRFQAINMLLFLMAVMVIVQWLTHCESFSKTYNINVVCYDYIGYGAFSGKWASETNNYASIDIIMKHLLKTIDANKIYHIGFSLGTGVVVDWCFKNNWATPII